MFQEEQEQKRAQSYASRLGLSLHGNQLQDAQTIREYLCFALGFEDAWKMSWAEIAGRLCEASKYKRRKKLPSHRTDLHKDIVAKGSQSSGKAREMAAKQDAVSIEVLNQLRAAIQKCGIQAKTVNVLREAGVTEQIGRKGLRQLEAEGEYKGFARPIPAKYRP